jgi:hypothetical protein
VNDGLYEELNIDTIIYPHDYDRKNKAIYLMSIGNIILYVLGITQIILLVLSLVMLALNKEISTTGRIFRGLQIVVVPLLGPLFIIIEMVILRARRETEKTNRN